MLVAIFHLNLNCHFHAMPITTPSALYRQKLSSGIRSDPVQAAVVSRFDMLQEDLLKPRFSVLGAKRPRGLYLHGQVGIGKTFLMDLFYESLPDARKRRQHFHEFMQGIHRALKEESGHKDPLKNIGKSIASEIDVLCLDELFITDIADGMIVYRLFESLFASGVVLLITSNFPVEKLYKDDLQPALFEPAIALIRENTEQLFLDSEIDYRMLRSDHHRTYFTEEEADFPALYAHLNENAPWQATPLHVHGRQLTAVRHSDSLAWFAFADLCEGPRSQQDYLHLSRLYKVFLLSGIPRFIGQGEDHGVVMGIEDGEGISATGRSRKSFTREDNAMRRFISLVDVLYDNGNHLYLSAAVPLNELYRGKALKFEFQRTRSRLTEMQSGEYLNSAISP